MAAASIYADFARAEPAPVETGTTSVSREDADQRSRAAYDKGYSSGWDDATAAAARRNDAVTADLERAIQDMGFTYHEAVEQVRKEFRRFVRELLDTFLPSLAAHGLRDNLQARIEALAAPAAEAPVELYVPPRLAETFASLAENADVFPISLISEASLSDAQAFARIGEVEWSVDFTQLLADLETAMSDTDDMPEDMPARLER